MPGPDSTTLKQEVPQKTLERRIPPKLNTRRQMAHQRRSSIQARNEAVEAERATQTQLAGTREELKENIEARRIAEEATEIDSLTGLLNAKGFNKAIGKEIARAERTGDEIALVFFDINGLKLVNDTLGHEIGNERIKTAADILSVSFRPTDIVARLGDKADEFVAALPMRDVRTIEERYSEVNMNARAASENWEGYPILLPAGAVKLDKSDIAGSITRADHAMYKAKELSRDIGENVIRYEPETVPVA